MFAPSTDSVGIGVDIESVSRFRGLTIEKDARFLTDSDLIQGQKGVLRRSMVSFSSDTSYVSMKKPSTAPK